MTIRIGPRRGAPLALIGAGAAVWMVWRASRPRLELRGRVVAITGGSRGLGLTLAREFGRHGARIAICGRGQADLDRATERLEADGVQVHAMTCDISDEEQVRGWIGAIEARFGGVDILVNNAGIIQVGPLQSMTVEDFRRSLEINLMGAVHASLAAIPAMRARDGGRIVNITSIGGKVAIPHLLPYDVAKFALVGFSEGLRAELARENIIVTTIVPGLMRTGSPPQAIFKGRKSDEYALFAAASATPLTTTSAERAARRIVEAARIGEAEVTLTWQAKLLRAAHAIAPGATTDLMGAVNRILPAHDGSTDAARGTELPEPTLRRALDAVSPVRTLRGAPPPRR